MTRAKAVLRAQALHRLSKDKAATVAEAELAAEHLERLRTRFDLSEHEIDPPRLSRIPPPPPPVPAPVPGFFASPFGGAYFVVNGQAVFVGGNVRVTFTGTTSTASNHFF